jgi:hypothetical protein
MQKLLAVWNTELKLWIKPTEGLFSERLELFSATWPTSGMTQNGQAFELPMQVLHTKDSEFSSLHNQDQRFGTPNTMDSLPPRFGEAYERIRNAGGRKNRLSSGNLREQVVHLLPMPANLPTPTVSDQYTGNLSSTQQKPGSMHSVTLAQVFHKTDLFPTPVASEGTKAPSQQTSETKSKTGQVWLSNVAKDIEQSNQLKLFPTLRASDSYERRNQKTMDRIAKDGGDMTMTTLARTTTEWGKFEPAIRRWEAIIGRPAPEPTKPDGKDGNHRLSSKFTEWMMGLPDGWITDIGLKRNDELKACGNGVVPQQAELALSLLCIKEILERN